jgi:hypothetical protein
VKTKKSQLSFYSRIWQGFKRFPHILYQGSDKAPETSKEAVSALISASLACFVMMITHHLAEISISTDINIQKLGDWILDSKY